MQDAGEVRAAIRHLFDAIVAKSYDEILDCYLQDERLFIFLESWEGKVEGFDRELLDAGWRRLLEPATFSRIELDEDARSGRDGDLGWVGGTVHSTFQVGEDDPVDVSQRGTWILERHDGRWVVAFEHVSFPADDPYGTG